MFLSGCLKLVSAAREHLVLVKVGELVGPKGVLSVFGLVAAVEFEEELETGTLSESTD